jgi:hypothetical protein
MPSFFMRFRRVEGGTPKAFAAPHLPAINPLVISTTSEMCSLSASASVHTLPGSESGLEFPERIAFFEIPLAVGIRRLPLLSLGPTLLLAPATLSFARA